MRALGPAYCATCHPPDVQLSQQDGHRIAEGGGRSDARAQQGEHGVQRAQRGMLVARVPRAPQVLVHQQQQPRQRVARQDLQAGEQ